MKHLLMTTALIAVGAAAPALADTSMSGSNAEANSNAAHSAYMSQRAEGQIRASDFLGMTVYAAAESGETTEVEGAQENWEDIGEINDVIMSRDGQIQAVLVDIGGFLGMGERQVAVTLDKLNFVSEGATENAEDFYLVLNADPATLEDAPEFQTNVNASADAGSMGDQSEQDRDTAAADTDGMTNADDENYDTAAESVEENAEEAGEDVAQAANEAGQEMSEAGEEMEQTAENAGQEMSEGAEELERTAENAGQEMSEGAEEVERTAENAGQEMSEGAEDVERTAENAVDAENRNDNMTAETDQGAEPNPMGTPIGDDYLTAENLDGARVYDSNDEWVGEISELIVAGDGEITEAIVDVGGFLGIGEKPVALKISELQILRQDDGEEVRIYTEMAEADLEAMPRFEQ